MIGFEYNSEPKLRRHTVTNFILMDFKMICMPLL